MDPCKPFLGILLWSQSWVEQKKKVGPAAEGRWLSPSSPFSWDPTWTAVSSSGAQHKKDMDLLDQREPKDVQRAVAPLLQRQDEWPEAVQPGEERTPTRTYCSLSACKRSLLGEKKYFTKACSDRTRDSIFKLKEGKFRHWNKLFRGAMHVPLQED